VVHYKCRLLTYLPNADQQYAAATLRKTESADFIANLSLTLEVTVASAERRSQQRRKIDLKNWVF